MAELRPYQELAIKQIKECFGMGEDVILQMPTGSGKTVVFSQILKECYLKKIPALMIVRGRQLVAQAEARLRREGISFGVYMANYHGFRKCEPIQIGSIDTILRRKEFPPARVVVADEVHLFTSKASKDFLDHYKDSLKLGVTATPWPESGLGHISRTVIKPTTFTELADQGYVVRPRYFAPSVFEMKGVKTAGQDYVQSDLEKYMNKNNLIGDVVKHYKERANGRKAVCFATGINHSLRLASVFRDNGIFAVHMDANTPLDERQKLADELRRSQGGVLCNVGVLGLGIDYPWLDCVIDARPTKSLILYHQHLGRATRPFEGKKDFIYLDHAGNCLRHGMIEEDIPARLDTTDSVHVVKSPTTCMICFAVFLGSVCPSCDNRNPVKFRRVEVKEGTLVELTPELIQKNYKKKLEQMRKVGKDGKPYKRGWKYFQAVRELGKEEAEKLFPPRKVPDWIRQKLANNVKSR